MPGHGTHSAPHSPTSGTVLHGSPSGPMSSGASFKGGLVDMGISFGLGLIGKGAQKLFGIGGRKRPEAPKVDPVLPGVLSLNAADRVAFDMSAQEFLDKAMRSNATPTQLQAIIRQNQRGKSRLEAISAARAKDAKRMENLANLGSAQAAFANDTAVINEQNRNDLANLANLTELAATTILDSRRD